MRLRHPFFTFFPFFSFFPFLTFCSRPEQVTERPDTVELVTDEVMVPGIDSAYPAVASELRFSSVAAGELTSCALTETGAAHCWGSVGNRSWVPTVEDVCTEMDGSPMPCVRRPLRVITEDRYASLDRLCGLTTDGRITCWDETGEQSAPRVMQRFRSLAAGSRHNCGITTNGTAICWGANDRGQLGDGTQDSTGLPTQAAIPAPTTLATIAVGDDFTCALTPGGTAWCWGDNTAGQVGAGEMDSLPHATPAAVRTSIRFSALSAGGRQVCGLEARTGRVFCWGARYARGDPAPAPRRVLVPPAVAVSVGGPRVCSVEQDGGVWCWGRFDVVGVDAEEEQGPEHLERISRPARLRFPFRSVSVGRYHACGVDASRFVRCWGDDYRGQLGLGI